MQEEVPYLTLVIRYRMHGMPTAAGNAEKKTRDETWRELLDEADWPVFNSLRAWRNQHSREHGLPPYIICTNRQLAEIAHQRPQSLSALGRIEGIGAAKLEKYGPTLLNLLAATPAQEQADAKA